MEPHRPRCTLTSLLDLYSTTLGVWYIAPVGHCFSKSLIDDIASLRFQKTMPLTNIVLENHGKYQPPPLESRSEMQLQYRNLSRAEHIVLVLVKSAGMLHIVFGLHKLCFHWSFSNELDSDIWTNLLRIVSLSSKF